MIRAHDRVYSLLERDEKMRSNDRRLMLAIWRSEGLYLTDEQIRQFMQVTPPETIRRERQKIQAKGQFLPDKKTQEARKELEYQVKAQIINDKVVVQQLRWL